MVGCEGLHADGMPCGCWKGKEVQECNHFCVMHFISTKYALERNTGEWDVTAVRQQVYAASIAVSPYVFRNVHNLV